MVMVMIMVGCSYLVHVLVDMAKPWEHGMASIFHEMDVYGA